MLLETLPAVQALSLSEKSILLDELWEDLARHVEAEPPDPEIVAILEERWKAYLDDSSTASPAADVWERIRSGKRRCK